jgi:hypothetical protein
MDHQEPDSLAPCQHSESVSQLSLLLMEENVTHQADDHVALRTEGCKATSIIWRERVTQWCYDVVDHLRVSRSTVYVAMSILDRYFVNCVNTTTTNSSSHSNVASDRSYEAAALTALFLAVRIRGGENLEVVDLVRMSRLGVTIKEIVEVGKEMTQFLSFERRLLTPAEFVQQLTTYLPSGVYDQARVKEVTASALFYTEVCVVDSFFAGVKASEIALASMLNALGTDVSLIIDGISAIPGVKFNPELVGSLCTRLKSLRNKSASSNKNNNEPHIIPDEDEALIAPQVRTAPIIKTHISSPSRVVSSDTICIKRSYTCVALSDLDGDDESTTTPSNKRPISPALVTDKKRRRTSN